MKDGWKGFWIGLGTAILGAISAVIAILVGRSGRDGTPVPPEQIAKEADAQIAAKREDIKSDSDQALADRFNRLAKKEEKK